MPKEFRAAVDASGRILYGGWGDPDDPKSYDVEPGLSAGQVRRVYDAEPDFVTARDAGDKQPWRQATAEELAAVVAESSLKAARATLTAVPFLHDVLQEFCAVVAPLTKQTPEELAAQVTAGVIARMVARGQ